MRLKLAHGCVNWAMGVSTGTTARGGACGHNSESARRCLGHFRGASFMSPVAPFLCPCCHIPITSPFTSPFTLLVPPTISSPFTSPFTSLVPPPFTFQFPSSITSPITSPAAHVAHGVASAILGGNRHGHSMGDVAGRRGRDRSPSSCRVLMSPIGVRGSGCGA